MNFHLSKKGRGNSTALGMHLEAAAEALQKEEQQRDEAEARVRSWIKAIFGDDYIPWRLCDGRVVQKKTLANRGFLVDMANVGGILVYPIVRHHQLSYQVCFPLLSPLYIPFMAEIPSRNPRTMSNS